MPLHSLMRASLDHLVFAVSPLERGASWLEERLGVPLSPGGQHTSMGTHNRLLRLGPSSYIELIAIDPGAGKPDRRRWFDLDALSEEAGLGTPQLLTWVASTTGLGVSGCSAAYDAGKVQPMSRAVLSWLITIRDDGSLPEGGTLPSLIEWPEGVHPAAGLPERNVTLQTLELRVPDPDRTGAALKSIGLEAAANRVRIIRDETGPGLRAILGTPRGTVSFSSSRSEAAGIGLA